MPNVRCRVSRSWSRAVALVIGTPSLFVADTDGGSFSHPPHVGEGDSCGERGDEPERGREGDHRANAQIVGSVCASGMVASLDHRSLVGDHPMLTARLLPNVVCPLKLTEASPWQGRGRGHVSCA